MQSRGGDCGGPPLDRATTPAKVPGLRQTARKCLPLGKRLGGLPAHRDSQPQARPSSSRPGAAQTEGRAAFGQPVSIKVLRMEAPDFLPKAKGNPAASWGKSRDEDGFENVGDRQASLAAKTKIGNEPPSLGLGASAHGEVMVGMNPKKSAETARR